MISSIFVGPVGLTAVRRVFGFSFIRQKRAPSLFKFYVAKME